jgi:hypothetical protein
MSLRSAVLVGSQLTATATAALSPALTLAVACEIESSAGGARPASPDAPQYMFGRAPEWAPFC